MQALLEEWVTTRTLSGKCLVQVLIAILGSHSITNCIAYNKGQVAIVLASQVHSLVALYHYW